MDELLLFSMTHTSNNRNNRPNRFKGMDSRPQHVQVILYAIGEKSNHRCVHCGTRLKYAFEYAKDRKVGQIKDDEFTIEHIIPLCFGGTWDDSNLVVHVENVIMM